MKEGKVLAYIRVSTNQQDNNNQKLVILEYASKNGMLVADFIEVELTSRRSEKDRRIEELLSRLDSGDTLITTELSRLGRSTAQVLLLVNKLIEMDVRIIVLKQSLDIKGSHDMQSKVMVTMFALFSELERDLISLRTKEALGNKKSAGIKLGKPVGTIQGSKFDKDLEKIKELLAYRLSVRKITKVLGYGNHISLNTISGTKSRSRNKAMELRTDSNLVCR